MSKEKRGILRMEGGLLLAGFVLLSICVYFIATMDQRVRATDKIDRVSYNDQYYRFADIMAETFIRIHENYVEEVDPQKIFEGALAGMFSALDPHSAYLGAANFKEMSKDTEGEFSGIGIHIDQRDGVLTVVSPIPGTPAARIGLRPWDRIIEINGESTEGMTTRDAVEVLTGPIGTRVDIVIFRESERRPIPYTIIRDRVKIESVYSNVDSGDHVSPFFKYLLDQKIGYVRLARFSEDTAGRLKQVLREMDRSGIQGLILDVRFNPGGLLPEGVEVSDLFLNKGDLIVATKGRALEQDETHRARNDMMVDWPMVLLINHGSASASEILAGALKDHRRAVLVGPRGTNTFGKGSVQTIAPLSTSLEKDEKGNDLPNAIKITTARFYSPNNSGPDGESLHGVGIEPDITVELADNAESELLSRGLLLGSPSYVRPEDENNDNAAEKPETNNTESESSPNQNESGAPGQDALDEFGVPFYERKKDGEPDRPATEDVQLQYGVDLLRALLIVNHGR